MSRWSGRICATTLGKRWLTERQGENSDMYVELMDTVINYFKWMRARDVKCETSGPLSYFLPPYSGLLAQAQPIFKFSYPPVKFQDYILHSGDLSTPGKILRLLLSLFPCKKSRHQKHILLWWHKQPWRKHYQLMLWGMVIKRSTFSTSHVVKMV